MIIIRFTLPIPADLNDWLVKQASKHNRSKTQEIVNILKLKKSTTEAMGYSGQDEKWLSLKGDK